MIQADGLDQKLISLSPSLVKKKGQNDYKRFVQQKTCTKEGEITAYESFEINELLIQEEMRYDGFYAVCTNLESSPEKIISINQGRWEIEESFRIMKSEFKSRPVFLSRDDRIEAHFTTCFISLLIYRLLEKSLNLECDMTLLDAPKENYTCSEIIQTLREMNFHKIKHEGYIPLYQRTKLTDALHETFGFRTEFEIINEKMMKNIKKMTMT